MSIVASSSPRSKQTPHVFAFIDRDRRGPTCADPLPMPWSTPLRPIPSGSSACCILSNRQVTERTGLDPDFLFGADHDFARAGF